MKLERELVYSQNACSNKQGGFDKIQMTKSKSARKSLVKVNPNKGGSPKFNKLTNKFEKKLILDYPLGIY